MRIRTEPGSDRLQVNIEDELTIYTVADNRATLLEQWHQECPLEMDLSDVSEIDSAGIQWLLQILLEGERNQLSVSFINPSQPVKESLELLHLTHRLSGSAMVSSRAAEE